MTELLDDSDLDYEKEDMVNETLAEVDRLLGEYRFDEVLPYFEDVRVEWDVLVDEDCNFYRAGCDELMSY